MPLKFHGVEIVPDGPDAWDKVAMAIDRAYNDFCGQRPMSDMRQYNYCGKWLLDMTYQECVTALARFKIPCDDLSGSKQSRNKPTASP